MDSDPLQKGEQVLYFDKESGTHLPGVVHQVDSTISPPSYGVHIPSLGVTRETVRDRLTRAPQAASPAAPQPAAAYPPSNPTSYPDAPPLPAGHAAPPQPPTVPAAAAGAYPAIYEAPGDDFHPSASWPAPPPSEQEQQQQQWREASPGQQPSTLAVQEAAGHPAAAGYSASALL